MKKLVFLTFVISCYLLVQFQCFSKPYQTEVKGGFKNCTTTEYRYKNGKIVNKAGEIGFKRVFDNQGNTVELISYENNKVSQINKITNKYNLGNLLIESVFYDESGKPKIKTTSAYDEKTNKIGDTTYNLADQVVWQRGSYKYDKNNFMIEETHEMKIDSNNYSQGTTYYKNDDKGNKIEESAKRGLEISGEVSGEEKFSDKDNQSSGQASISSKDIFNTVTYKYIYDNKNNIIKETRISPDGFKLVKEYKYDNFGNVTEEIYPPDDSDKEKKSLKRVHVYSK